MWWCLHDTHCLADITASLLIWRSVRRPADTPGDEARAPKRLRFSDVQRAALEALGERSAWSLPGLSREEKDAFCLQHNISKACSFFAWSDGLVHVRQHALWLG